MQGETEKLPPDSNHIPPWSALFQAFSRIGILSFGGPAAQIAVMHKELVQDRPWLSEQQFLNALSFCMLLPGPEAMQLATYCGWRLRGIPGGLLAGILFVIPGAAFMLALVAGYAAWGAVPLVESLFLGIKAAVVIIVLQALLKLARKALDATDRWIIAVLSFLAIFGFGIPFPLIIACAATYGFATPTGTPTPVPLPAAPQTARTVAIWLGIWWAPIAAAWVMGQDLLVQIGLFFSKLAVVTFGGAYAVLAYMTQEVVQDHGWLTTAQMMDGLGLAETTPGPLILVTEFVGYLAADPVGLGVIAACLTVWVTFAPCFLWIFAGAPYIEWISAKPRLTGALRAITAAVVGVILNLSLWFAANVFFAPAVTENTGFSTLLALDPGSLNIHAALLTILAALWMLWRGRGLVETLLLTAVAGVALEWFL